MNLAQFLAELSRSGVKLRIEGDRLKYDAPRGVLTPTLLEELRKQKQPILDFLRDAEKVTRTQLASILPRSRSEELPLGFAQQRLWFLDRLQPGTPSYNVPWAIRLRGPLNSNALQQALTGIQERHETLRTRFLTIDGKPQQSIDPGSELAMPIIDLQSLSSQSIEAEIVRYLQDESRNGFDLENGPLVRASLLHIGTEDHVLMLTLHHIVADAPSIDIFARELGILYEAFSQGRPSPLPPLPIQYADFALWQREWLRGKVFNRQLSYWKQQLAAPTALELPTDRPRPAVMSTRGGCESISLPEELCQALFDLGQREQATSFMVLLATFIVLLYRYTHQEDILVGAPMASRNRPETEGLIGFFANTLVLRADLAGKPNFLQLLSRIRKVNLEAYAHQDLPFEKLVEELDPQRDLSRNPLFQVMFAFQNDAPQPIRLPRLRVTPLKTEHVTSKFDLLLSMQRRGQRLVGSVEYSADLFNADTIRRMIDHFKVLLEGIVEDPRQRIDQLPLLLPEQRYELVNVWSQADAGINGQLNLLDRFAEQVGRRPDGVAVVLGEQRLTFALLNAKANQLAHYLIKQGVQRDALVGICMDRSVDMIISVLAILKAGAAYVPLDPAYPTSRLDFMLKDTSAPVLLTQSHLLELLPPRQGHTFCVDTQWSEVEPLSSEDPALHVSPENLAYVIYTSGSTGRPKGVMMDHGPLSNLIAWQLQATTVAEAITLQFASLSFDVSFQEIFSTWLSGGMLVLLPEELRRDPPRLLDYLQAHRVQRLFLPFVALQNVAEACMTRPRALGSLREIITAGEQLQMTPALVRLLERIPGCTLHNQYGPTESHVVTAWTLTGDLRQIPRLPPIGRPISGAAIYILDDQLNPTPRGVAGELCIGGEVISRGYLHRPELTAQKFVNDPYRSGQARLYRTGDRARFLPDGNIQYLGRVDDQVKIRGYRVELGELETSLQAHPAIREAAARVWEPQLGDQRLVAYYVPHPGQNPQPAELRQFIKQQVPGYMLPSALVSLETLPQTPSGKLDRRALPEPTGERGGEQAYVAPGSPTERALAEIWQEVLKLEQIGVHDNFFESGGHSLLAAQVASRVLQTFDVELPLACLFQRPTIAELAAHIEAAPERAAPARPPLVHKDHQGEVPASFAQERLWFMEQTVPDSAFYNLPLALRLRGPLDRDALQRTLNAIVERHSVFRTTFRAGANDLSQVISSHTPVEIRCLKLTEIAEADRENEVRRLVKSEVSQSFDLIHGPPFRLKLLQFAEDDHVLMITVHHIISDGWSLRLLCEELASLYADRISPLPDSAIQYADFAVWQRQSLQGEVLSQQVRYWKETLAEITTLELPTDRSRPAIQTFRGAHVTRVLPASLRKRLQALSAAEGVTLFMTLLAAFKVLLHRYSGQDDIVVGSPIANRNRTELESVMGFFVNNLVMCTDVSGNPSYRELLSRVKDVALGAFAHQDLPFEKLVEELEPERDLSRNPLFQVAFALQTDYVQQLELGDVEVSFVPLNCHTTRFDQEMHLWDDGETIRLTCVYAEDLFDKSTIERMLRHYEVLVEAAVSDPDQQLSRMPLMTQAEQRQVRTEWNKTSTNYPREATVDQLFREQAVATPHAIAVEFEGAQMTYGQLNARANQVAHHLRGLGVGAGSCVGLCLQRSLEMVVGVLGILKAGGAYVPLDANYPASRLQFMVQDTGATVLLTDRPSSAKLSRYGGKAVCLDRDWPEIAPESTADFDPHTTTNSLAYVIYTSGSTGRPKGTSIVHRSVVRLVKDTNYATFEAGEVFLQFAPLSFDASTFELWGSLLNGSKLLVFPHHTPSLEELGHFIQSNGVTTLWLTAALFHRMVDEHLECLRGVRQLLAGGDRLLVDQANKVIESLGERRLINGYGPTENTTFSCCHVMTSASRIERTVPIGRPISNTQAYILDGEMRLVPIGVPGELYLGGDGLAREYVNQPELTREKFIEHTFSGAEKTRLYRTGDRARWLSNGTIEFLGRVDQQVKIRGFRIEPAEIETWLSRHSDVKQAAVVAYEDDGGDRQLVAYVVADAEGRQSVSELRRFLRDQLPDYMVPNTFVFLDALPMSPNGKLQRDRLPSPSGERPEVETQFVSPRTELERQIASVWCEILGIERVGLHDNFFDLGGHSLRLLAVRGRLKEVVGQELSVIEMFKYPTISGLAEHVSRGPQAPTPHTRVDGTSDRTRGNKSRLSELRSHRRERGRA